MTRVTISYGHRVPVFDPQMIPQLSRNDPEIVFRAIQDVPVRCKGLPLVPERSRVPGDLFDGVGQTRSQVTWVTDMTSVLCKTFSAGTYIGTLKDQLTFSEPYKTVR